MGSPRNFIGVAFMVLSVSWQGFSGVCFKVTEETVGTVVKHYLQIDDETSFSVPLVKLEIDGNRKAEYVLALLSTFPQLCDATLSVTAADFSISSTANSANTNISKIRFFGDCSIEVTTTNPSYHGIIEYSSSTPSFEEKLKVDYMVGLVINLFNHLGGVGKNISFEKYGITDRIKSIIVVSK